MNLTVWGYLSIAVCVFALSRYAGISEPDAFIVAQEQQEDRLESAKALAKEEYQQQQLCLKMTPQEWCNRDRTLQDYYDIYYETLAGNEFSETQFNYDIERLIYLLIAIITGFLGFSLTFGSSFTRK